MRPSCRFFFKFFAFADRVLVWWMDLECTQPRKIILRNQICYLSLVDHFETDFDSTCGSHSNFINEALIFEILSHARFHEVLINYHVR